MEEKSGTTAHLEEWTPRAVQKKTFTPRIIGIMGKIGSGKSTAAAHLEKYMLERTHMAWRRVAFAERLKNAVAAFGGIDPQLLYTTEGKARFCEAAGKSYGAVLQDVGMMFRNQFGVDVWVNACFSGREDQCLIVEDVRYENELAAIKKRGGFVIKLTRNCKVDVSGRDLSHPSETTVDKMKGDVELANDGTLEHFYTLLECAVHKPWVQQ